MTRTVRVPKRALKEIKLDEHYRRYRTVFGRNYDTAFVPGEGDPMAKVVVVGEAPGAEEERLGKPFIGRSGNLLSKLLKSIGLSRQDVFITNLVKYRPPDNADPHETEVSAASALLRWELVILQPKVIVPMGRFASTIYNESGLNMSTLAGTCRERLVGTDHRAWVTPQFHPAAALRSASIRQRLFEDFSQVKHALGKEA